MPVNISKIIEMFSCEVRKTLGNRVKQIILYGSYARGDFNKNSDVDIMILTDCNDKEIENFRDIISDIAYDIELDKGIVISPVLKNIDKYNQRTEIVPFYMNIKKEGIIL